MLRQELGMNHLALKKPTSVCVGGGNYYIIVCLTDLGPDGLFFIGKGKSKISNYKHIYLEEGIIQLSFNIILVYK